MGEGVLAFLLGAWGFYLAVDKPAGRIFRGVMLGWDLLSVGVLAFLLLSGAYRTISAA